MQHSKSGESFVKNALDLVKDVPDLNVIRLTHGKWPGILSHFGLEDSFLNGKHGPCPMCEGKDRFRFINKQGDGWWICNQCGSGDGMDLLQAVLQCDFKTARERVMPMVHGVVSQPPPGRPSKQERRVRLDSAVNIWKEASASYDVLDEYLQFRGLKREEYAGADLKFEPMMPYYDDGKLVDKRPCMLARIADRSGKLAALHRTYLTEHEDGTYTTERKITRPARDWGGGVIRLFNIRKGSRVIVAEGIETALSVRAIVYRKHHLLVPCIAAVNAGNMEKLALPENITRVMVAADNDTSYAGQKAAYTLTNRLVVNDKRNATVIMPANPGSDFNDELENHSG
jgi:putative DNA primase/helicase